MEFCRGIQESSSMKVNPMQLLKILCKKTHYCLILCTGTALYEVWGEKFWSWKKFLYWFKLARYCRDARYFYDASLHNKLGLSELTWWAVLLFGRPAHRVWPGWRGAQCPVHLPERNTRFIVHRSVTVAELCFPPLFWLWLHFQPYIAALTCTLL